MLAFLYRSAGSYLGSESVFFLFFFIRFFFWFENDYLLFIFIVLSYGFIRNQKHLLDSSYGEK